MSTGKKNILREEEEAVEVVDEQPIQRTPKHSWKLQVERFSYRAIVNNVPYMVFLALLCVLYISNNKNAVEVQRSLSAVNDTLKELKWEYVDARSRMVSAQMEIEVMQRASEIGLKPMLMPAFMLADNSSLKKNDQTPE